MTGAGCVARPEPCGDVGRRLCVRSRPSPLPVAGWPGRPRRRRTCVFRLRMPPGEQVMTYPAITSDGQVIAYVSGRTASTSQLYLRTLGDFVARPVANSVGAQYPFFSPDGRGIAFFAGGKLRRASVAGGAAIDLAPSATPWGGTWDTRGPDRLHHWSRVRTVARAGRRRDPGAAHETRRRRCGIRPCISRATPRHG